MLHRGEAGGVEALRHGRQRESWVQVAGMRVDTGRSPAERLVSVAEVAIANEAVNFMKTGHLRT